MSMFHRLYNAISEGTKRYGFDTWQAVPEDDHLSHAREHLDRYLRGDRSEDHLGHALCRVIYAIEGQDGENDPCGRCVYDR